MAKTAAPAPKAQSKPPKEEKKRKPEPTPAPEGSDDSDESGGDFGSGSGSGSEGDSSGSSDDDAEEIEEEGDEGIGKVVEGAAVSKEDEQLAALRKIITKARLGCVNVCFCVFARHVVMFPFPVVLSSWTAANDWFM